VDVYLLGNPEPVVIDEGVGLRAVSNQIHGRIKNDPPELSQDCGKSPIGLSPGARLLQCPLRELSREALSSASSMVTAAPVLDVLTRVVGS
jgi:hypothetical protein